MNRQELINNALLIDWMTQYGIITPYYLEQLRYRLLVIFKCIKNIEVYCDTNNKNIILKIKIRRLYKFITFKKKLKAKILSNMEELLPNYEVVIVWE